MKISIVDEHSYVSELLSERSIILDLGCRGMKFTEHFRMYGHTVFPIDVDLLPGLEPSKDYIRVAITGQKEQRVGIQRTSDPQATCVIPGNEIWTHTIESFSELAKVDFFDLIKMDVEGSEYGVIMSLTKAPAKQLSIEFHLHTGIYKVGDVEKMEDHLSLLGYMPLQHEMTRRHGLGLNYWDSLFVLRDGYR